MTKTKTKAPTNGQAIDEDQPPTQPPLPEPTDEQAPSDAPKAADDDEHQDDDEELTEEQKARREREQAVVEIKFRGFTFTIPKYRDFWPLQAEYLLALVASQPNRIYELAEALLGPGQWSVLNMLCPRRIDFTGDPDDDEDTGFAGLLGNAVNTRCVA